MALKIFPLNNYTPHYNNITLQQLQCLLIKHKKHRVSSLHPHLINMSSFAHKYVFQFSIFCPGSLTLFVKNNAVKTYWRSTVLYWWKLLSKDAPQIAMSYILVQDIFDKLHWLQSFICWNNKAPFLYALYHLPCL